MATANVNGIKMAYDAEGDGPAVVFLHGFPFNRTMWREQVEALSGDYRTIAPDFRGHGETEVRDSATMEEMARDVAALLEELNVESAGICGLSMGGYVAFNFCRLFPQKVQSLILADTRAQADTEEAHRTREEQSRKILSEGMESIADALLQKALAPQTLASRPQIVARVREMITTTNPRGAAAAHRGMAARADHSDFLEEIDWPTLVIVGEEDQITPPEVAEKMHGYIQGSHLEVLEGAGHLSNIENPEHFNRALKEFLGAQR